jgi:hypothetical protein
MSEIGLLDQTVQWLEEAPISGQTLDDKVRQLLQAEYMRKLGQFHRTDKVLSRKYGMDFLQFVGQRIVEKKHYCWEVETDAMDWETAISGIQTIERRLAVLREA